MTPIPTTPPNTEAIKAVNAFPDLMQAYRQKVKEIRLVPLGTPEWKQLAFELAETQKQLMNHPDYPKL